MGIKLKGYAEFLAWLRPEEGTVSEYKIGTIRKENPVSETAGNPEAKVDVSVETTYQPSDAPEPAEEPAKPIEGDTPLPLEPEEEDDD